MCEQLWCPAQAQGDPFLQESGAGPRDLGSLCAPSSWDLRHLCVGPGHLLHIRPHPHVSQVIWECQLEGPIAQLGLSGVIRALLGTDPWPLTPPSGAGSPRPQQGIIRGTADVGADRDDPGQSYLHKDRPL